MPSRGTKFYRKNEEEVMSALGLKPTKNSGAGWIEKEDGQNDFVICQLKSTDAKSIGVKQVDIRTLEKNAQISHKLPVFAIQFLNTGEVWLMSKPEDFVGVSEYIQTGKCGVNDLFDINVESLEDKKAEAPNRVIKSSEESRIKFNNDVEKQKEENRRKWKNR